MDLKKVGTILYMLLMVFYGIYTMVLSIQAYSKFTDSTQGYLNIASNLSEHMVADVQVSTTTCPNGYYSIFDWDWEGSSTGCDCTSSTYFSSHSGVYTGACNSTEISKKCKTVEAVESVRFDSIEGASNQKQQVCAKRSLEKFSDIIGAQTGSCSTSQKQCGNPNKKETIICVAQNEDCPVYAMQMSASVDLTKYPANEWKQLNLASGQYLYVNFNGLTASALPTSEYRFTQNGVCKLENNSKRMPSGYTDYILVETTRSDCAETDDTFRETSFSIAENKYYSINIPPVVWSKMSQWSDYSVPTATELFKSYQRPFLPWKIEARKSIKDLVDSADSIKSLKTAQLTVMIINIIVCIAVSIVLSVSQVYNLLGMDVPCIEGSGDSEQKRIVLIKKILTYGSKLLQIPFLIWAFSISSSKKGILKDAADESPSEPRFNDELQVFATQLEDDVYKKNLTALIILLITIVVDIVLALKSAFCKSPEKNSTQVEPAKPDEEHATFQNNQQNQQEMQNYNNTVNQPLQSFIMQPQPAPVVQFQQPAPVYAGQQQVMYATPEQQQQQFVYVQQPVEQQQPMYAIVQPQQQPVMYVQGVPTQQAQIVYQQF